MSNTGSSNSTGRIIGATTSSLTRYLPEPRSLLGSGFTKVLNTVGSVVQGAGLNMAGIDPTYAELINKQIEAQQQMQLVSFHSNIEKSKHETQMAAIRNVRTS